MKFGKPIVVHLLRGALGLVLLIAAFVEFRFCPVCSFTLGVGSLFAFGGCPTCWIFGCFRGGSGGL